MRRSLILILLFLVTGGCTLIPASLSQKTPTPTSTAAVIETSNSPAPIVNPTRTPVPTRVPQTWFDYSAEVIRDADRLEKTAELLSTYFVEVANFPFLIEDETFNTSIKETIIQFRQDAKALSTADTAVPTELVTAQRWFDKIGPEADTYAENLLAIFTYPIPDVEHRSRLAQQNIINVTEYLQNGFDVIENAISSLEMTVPDFRSPLNFPTDDSTGAISLASTPQFITGCDHSYPSICIPSDSPPLACEDISERRFAVIGSDPHEFDVDKNGLGCESD